METSEWLFEVMTPLGFTVHSTARYWEYITSIKHPGMSGQINLVIQTLGEPDEIRRSLSDENVFLFYRFFSSFGLICSVAKAEGTSGFLITAYRTEKIKRGIRIWTK
jgi:hypothetical protein